MRDNNQYMSLAVIQFGACATWQWTAFRYHGHVCPGIPRHLRRAARSRPETVPLPLNTGVLRMHVRWCWTMTVYRGIHTELAGAANLPCASSTSRIPRFTTAHVTQMTPQNQHAPDSRADPSDTSTTPRARTKHHCVSLHEGRRNGTHRSVGIGSGLHQAAALADPGDASPAANDREQLRSSDVCFVLLCIDEGRLRMSKAQSSQPEIVLLPSSSPVSSVCLRHQSQLPSSTELGPHAPGDGQ